MVDIENDPHVETINGLIDLDTPLINIFTEPERMNALVSQSGPWRRIGTADLSSPSPMVVNAEVIQELIQFVKYDDQKERTDAEVKAVLHDVAKKTPGVSLRLAIQLIRDYRNHPLPPSPSEDYVLPEGPSSEMYRQDYVVQTAGTRNRIQQYQLVEQWNKTILPIFPSHVRPYRIITMTTINRFEETLKKPNTTLLKQAENIFFSRYIMGINPQRGVPKLDEPKLFEMIKGELATPAWRENGIITTPDDLLAYLSNLNSEEPKTAKFLQKRQQFMAFLQEQIDREKKAVGLL